MPDQPWTDEAGVEDVVRDVLKFVERVAEDSDSPVNFPRADEFWQAHESDLEGIIGQYLMDPDGDVQESEFLSSESELFDGVQLTEEEIRMGLEYARSRRENPGGRPSKVEEWTERIRSGEADLADAEEDVSQPTLYKIMDRLGPN